MKKIIILVLCLFTCACTSKEPIKEILKREKYINNNQIKKENIYGCWTFNSLDVYKEEKLIYDSKQHGTINFYDNELEYCYFYENNKSKCVNLTYEIDGNFLKVEKNDILNENYTMYMYEKGNILDFSLTTVYDNMDYLYHMIYSKDCKLK